MNTTSEITWRESDLPAALCRARRYWLVRPDAIARNAFLGAVGVLLFLMLFGDWGGPAWASVYRALALTSIVVAWELFLHSRRPAVLAGSSTLGPFLAKTLLWMAPGLAAAAVLWRFLQAPAPSPMEFVAAGVLTMALVAGVRSLVVLMIRNDRMVERMLLLGSEDMATKLHKELLESGRNQEARVWVAGAAELTGNDGVGADRARVAEVVRRLRIERVVIAEASPERRREIAKALLGCKLDGVEVEDAADFYEKTTGKIWLKALSPEWMVCSCGFRVPRWYRWTKRSFDVLCAVLLLLAAAPVMLAIAVGIRATSPGPVLFRQQRVGLGGRPFTLIKFRTMHADAERDTGPVWTTPGDTRVTPLGRLLRMSRLDELPQAYNVLKGDMSFVGPRPERPYFVEQLQQIEKYYMLRHCVPPGITGWTQVNYRYGATYADALEKLQYDLYYIKHRSFSYDVLILLKTLKVVILGRGQ